MTTLSPRKIPMSENPSKIGNENSYTNQFFETLYAKINLTNPDQQSKLRHSIILASQSYHSAYHEYERQLASHEVQRELKKALSHLDKAAEGLVKVYAAQTYSIDIVNNLHDVISAKYPMLHGTLNHLRRGDGKAVTITSPLKSLDFVASIADALEQTVKSFPPRKTNPRSAALNRWLLIVSAQLEPAINRKLEQSHYYKEGKTGGYVSKKETSDSELLSLIIHPLDPQISISQLETAIKETRKERHTAPWTNYFPSE